MGIEERKRERQRERERKKGRSEGRKDEVLSVSARNLSSGPRHMTTS
jgi:hypothetical protein